MQIVWKLDTHYSPKYGPLARGEVIDTAARGIPDAAAQAWIRAGAAAPDRPKRKAAEPPKEE